MSSNQYRASGPWAAKHGDEVLDLELGVAEEADLLARGELEIVPRQYRVLSENYQVPQGEVFEGAFPIETEAALINGGHIERVRRDAVPTVDDVVGTTVPAEPGNTKPRRARTKENG